MAHLVGGIKRWEWEWKLVQFWLKNLLLPWWPSLPLGEVVLDGNENLQTKNFFVIKVSLSWEWHETFDEILHYNSFSLPPFDTTNQTRRYRKIIQWTLINNIANGYSRKQVCKWIHFNRLTHGLASQKNVLIHLIFYPDHSSYEREILNKIMMIWYSNPIIASMSELYWIWCWWFHILPLNFYNHNSTPT